MPEVPHRIRHREREPAATGVAPEAGWVAAGHLDELEAGLRWTQGHRHLFV